MSSDATERRAGLRQKVLFSSVVIGENNCGRVLNISPNGLALQTDMELVGDEFPQFRFKFSPSLDWVEASGRVAWRNNAKNVVGIEFIGLTEEGQKQIQTWIGLRRELGEAAKLTRPTDETGQPEGSKPQIPSQNSDLFGHLKTRPSIPYVEYSSEASGTPASDTNEDTDADANDLGVSDQSHRPVFPSIPSTLGPPASQTPSAGLFDSAVHDETLPPITSPIRYPHEAPPTADVAKQPTVTGPGAAIKIIGAALVAILLLSLFFFRRPHSPRSASIQKTQEPIQSLPPTTSHSQAVQPTPSVENPATLPPQPTVSYSGSAAPSRTRKHEPAYVLQVAAMIHEENANALAASLRQKDFPAFVIKMPTERFNHVLVGPYSSADAAAKAKNDLEKSGLKVIRTEWKVRSQ